VLDNEANAKVLSDLYSNADFVDMLLLFKQTGDLNVMLFKKVLIDMMKHIDAFVEPTILLVVLITELSDANEALHDYIDDIKGVIEAIGLMKL
jgi:hypothetical protein